MSKYLILTLYFFITLNFNAMEPDHQSKKNDPIQEISTLVTLCLNFYEKADEKNVYNKAAFSKVIKGQVNSDVSEKLISSINLGFIKNSAKDLSKKTLNIYLEFCILCRLTFNESSFNESSKLLTYFIKKTENNDKNREFKCAMLQKLIKSVDTKGPDLKILRDSIHDIGKDQLLTASIIKTWFDLYECDTTHPNEIKALELLLEHNNALVKDYFLNYITRYFIEFHRLAQKSFRLFKQIGEQFATDYEKMNNELKEYIKDDKNICLLIFYMRIHKKTVKFLKPKIVNALQLNKIAAELSKNEEFKSCVKSTYENMMAILCNKERRILNNIIEFIDELDYVAALFKIIDEFRIPGLHSWQWYRILCDNSFEAAGLSTHETNSEINDIITKFINNYGTVIDLLYELSYC